MSKKYIFFTGVALLMSLSVAKAQDAEILSQVEKNNTELQALRKRIDSEKYGYKAERALEAPEVGFDYLWGSPADIGNRKDISVTQSFDIAALSGIRRKVSESKSGLSDLSYSLNRQRILLEARQICIRLIWCNAMDAELSSRLALSAEIEKVCKEMFARGEIDVIETNKAHIAYLSQKNAYSRNMTEKQELLSELQRLNGGEYIEFTESSYDTPVMLPADFNVWYAEASQKSPELKYANRNVEVNAAEAKTIKMANWPTLKAGYMAELVKGSNFRGLTVGLAIPLWSVRSRTRQANCLLETAKLDEKDVKAQTYTRLKGLYEKAVGLKSMSDELSSSLVTAQEAMALTRKKFEDGEISLLDNIMELGLYYAIVDESLAVSRDYLLAYSELNSWSL